MQEENTKKKKDVIGWLNPDGTWFPCRFGQHGKLLVENKAIQETALYIGINSVSAERKKVTMEQSIWLHRHLEEFNEKQKESLLRHVLP